jgi:hypothetical protein
MSKGELGQFYTTQYEYILSNMTIPEEVNTIIEPFVGNGDLLKFLKNREKYTIEMYDIDPKVPNTASHAVVQRDTLRNPPEYGGKFVLTNPPYLARNKSKNKELYDMYDCNDLYKCFLSNLISNVCLGGIIIVPLNFISSIRKSDVELRRQFLQTYSILTINIFEEQVFDDTSYAVCSFHFMQRAHEGELIETYIYPSAKKMAIELNAENNYTIGGEIYCLPYDETIHVCRATRETKGTPTNILLKCIDDSMTSQLGFKLVADKDIFIDKTPNLSARSYASLVINQPLTLFEQEALVKKMNEYICAQREKYNSLFLTNYRENNTIARKRISFDLGFKICNYMLSSSLSTSLSSADSSTASSSAVADTGSL